MSILYFLLINLNITLKIVFDLQEPRQILQELKTLVKLKFSEGTAREQLSARVALDSRTAFLLYSHPGEKNPRRLECIYSLKKHLDSVDLSNEFLYKQMYSFLNVLHSVHKHDDQLADKYWNNLVKCWSRKTCTQRPFFFAELRDVCRK